MSACVYESFGKCQGGVTLYPHGGKCKAHGPGEPPYVDPSLTLKALRQDAGRVASAPVAAQTQLYDDRAIASGKRRSRTADYIASRNREVERKEARQ